MRVWKMFNIYFNCALFEWIKVTIQAIASFKNSIDLNTTSDWKGDRSGKNAHYKEIGHMKLFQTNRTKQSVTVIRYERWQVNSKN